MFASIAAMDPSVRMIFFAVAVAAFLIAAFGYTRGKTSFVAAGLAAFVFPFFWDALAEM